MIEKFSVRFGVKRQLFIYSKKIKVMKEKIAEIYLQNFGVEEMIEFVCSLTDEEILNLSLWIFKIQIAWRWIKKGARHKSILQRISLANKDI